MNDVTPLLSFRNFSVNFATDEGTLPAVRSVDLTIRAAEAVAVVGESGAGKSQLFHAMLGLQAKNAATQGEALFRGESLNAMSTKHLNQIRGVSIGMIFQDPMTALNPYLQIGKQLSEVLEVHQGMSRKAARQPVLAMLAKVKLPDPESCYGQYPHQLSGGMRQRVMIAMALLCEPQLIIADEPTTALDVTVQSDIIKLLADIHQEQGTAIVLITHDLPLVAGLCERVVIMYAGQIVETAAIASIHEQAQHPYTRALLASIPESTEIGSRLQGVEGQPPSPLHLPSGCAFHPRCSRAKPRCQGSQPSLDALNADHSVACFYPEDV